MSAAPLIGLRPRQVSHVLNVAFGVTGLFPEQLVYKTLPILDLPETDITSYVEDCSTFIDQAREQVQYTQVHTRRPKGKVKSLLDLV